LQQHSASILNKTYKKMIHTTAPKYDNHWNIAISGFF
jgi:hypothetical protein